MDIHTFPVGQMQANCYICVDEKTQKSLIIDPGDDATYILDQIIRLNITPIGIVATHGHFDHIMGAFEIQIALDIPFYLHRDDWFLLNTMAGSAKHFLGISYCDPAPQNPIDLSTISSIPFGNSEFSLLHVPGHTPGSIALFDKKDLKILSGDVLFAQGGRGRTDFLYSNNKDLLNSLERIFCLPENTVVYPGHGDITKLISERIYFT